MKKGKEKLKSFLKAKNSKLKAKTIMSFSKKSHRECYNGHRKIKDKRNDENL